jgi:hypothetical protein
MPRPTWPTRGWHGDRARSGFAHGVCCKRSPFATAPAVGEIADSEQKYIRSISAARFSPQPARFPNLYLVLNSVRMPQKVPIIVPLPQSCSFLHVRRYHTQLVALQLSLRRSHAAPCRGGAGGAAAAGCVRNTRVRGKRRPGCSRASAGRWRLHLCYLALPLPEPRTGVARRGGERGSHRRGRPLRQCGRRQGVPADRWTFLHR